MKSLVLGMGLAGALFSSLSMAYQFGDYAGVTTDKLINDYPGRYRGAANFIGAANWMEERMNVGSGYNAYRQNFSWVASNQTRSSQNVIVEAAGVTGKNLVVGAHFDTYPNRPTLQGLDDNASGAGVLTELARNLAGLSFEDGVTFIGFGAEEEGLRGSRAYVASLDTEARSRLTGMINIDSLITGDMMYAHAGKDSVTNPALTSLREQTLGIAQELGINLFTNPGLNRTYPAGTGCCSDGDSFLNLNIPIVYFESTNWEIGDLDGYTQTTNPAISGGDTWHSVAKDNETYLTNAFGPDRVAERLRAYSMLITRLVLEATNTDLRYSALSAANTLGAMQDSLKRQQQSLQQLNDRLALSLRNSNREVGSYDGGIFVQGQHAPASGFDGPLTQKAQQYDVQLYGNWQYTDWLNLGASLTFSRAKDDLEHDGKIDSDTWQASLSALLSDGGPLWANANVHVGRSDIEIDRRLNITNQGLTLLERKFKGDTTATVWGAKVKGGYDFVFDSLRTGPFIGLSYEHYELDGYKEKSNQRTAIATQDQTLDAVELSLGWQVNGQYPLNANLALQPYAELEWVEAYGNTRSDNFALRSLANDSIRRVDNAYTEDKHFGRARVGGLLSIGEHFGVYAEANQRLQHQDGDQRAYTLGLQYAF